MNFAIVDDRGLNDLERVNEDKDKVIASLKQDNKLLAKQIEGQRAITKAGHGPGGRRRAEDEYTPNGRAQRDQRRAGPRAIIEL